LRNGAVGVSAQFLAAAANRDPNIPQDQAMKFDDGRFAVHAAPQSREFAERQPLEAIDGIG
jgi:hypothetical protein